MIVPKGWNPIFWRKYARAIPLSVVERPMCDLRELGPKRSQLSPETLERISRDGQLKKGSARTRSKKR